jgi:hypothetical protein
LLFVVGKRLDVKLLNLVDNGSGASEEQLQERKEQDPVLATSTSILLRSDDKGDPLDAAVSSVSVLDSFNWMAGGFESSSTPCPLLIESFPLEE